MLNTLINSTTLGQAIGATFEIDGTGSLTERRLTPGENCRIQEPVYERIISLEKFQALYTTGQMDKITRLNKAIESENIRVNSLAILLRELQLIDEMDTNEIVTIYVPTQLLKELQDMKVKYYLTSETPSNYYSAQEIEMWKPTLVLIQKLYFNLVFKNIYSCTKNTTEDKVRADRAILYNSMQTLMNTAYRTLKNKKTAEASVGTKVSGDAQIFGL